MLGLAEQPPKQPQEIHTRVQSVIKIAINRTYGNFFVLQYFLILESNPNSLCEWILESKGFLGVLLKKQSQRLTRVCFYAIVKTSRVFLDKESFKK